MNIPNILALANYLDRTVSADSFDMANWRLPHDHLPRSPKTNAEAFEGSCGTVACIAGHAMVLFEPDAPLCPEGQISDRAQDYLGLTDDQAGELFIPRLETHITTKARAVQVLRTLAETGEVTW